jgi:hypothetical protein
LKQIKNHFKSMKLFFISISFRARHTCEEDMILTPKVRLVHPNIDSPVLCILF